MMIWTLFPFNYFFLQKWKDALIINTLIIFTYLIQTNVHILGFQERFVCTEGGHYHI